MNCVFENEFMKMSLDELAPVLFTAVKKMPEGLVQFDNFCALSQSKLIAIASKSGGIAYSICDASLLQPYSFDLLINFYIRFASKSKEIFQSHKIFVLPKVKDSIDINEFFKLSNRYSIYFFDTLDEAKSSVYDDWSIYKKAIQEEPIKNQLVYKKN